MERVGETFRAAGVATICLVHGTFVGDDGWGFWRELGRVWPAGERGRRGQKGVVDFVVRELGNFTAGYEREFAAGIDSRAASAGQPAGVAVERWNWSSQNNHVGRVDAALRFIVHLARTAPRDGRRVLAWGHSHAGNVFALVTNLLTSDAATLERFFAAARGNYLDLFGRLPADSPWEAARSVLATDARALRAIPLDVVTFGTPVRYGWDSDGYARLLHIVHHRPDNVRPTRERWLPFRPLDAWRAREGDYVQRIGIAGSNWPPCWLSRWRARQADRLLHGIVQAGVTSDGWFRRARDPLRVADEGPTIAIDYGPQPGGPLRHLFGHGGYTRRAWLLFHAELVAQQFYDSASEAARAE